MPVSLRGSALLVGLVMCLSALGCSPQIGDKCTTSTDCSLRGDRQCDSTQPDGYCTVFNCEPDTCPEEAQCVAFNETLDPSCTDPRQFPRFMRTFCLRRCESDGDCRGGYVCADMGVVPNAWGASLVDSAPQGAQVCISPSTQAPGGPQSTEVCQPYDGGYPDVGYYGPDVLAAGDGPSGEDGVAEDGDGPLESAEGSADGAEDAGIDGADAADASAEAQESGADGAVDVAAEETAAAD